MSLVIEAIGNRGRSITASICPITNDVIVVLPGAPPKLVDPDDPNILAMLKNIFGSQIDLLLKGRNNYEKQ